MAERDNQFFRDLPSVPYSEPKMPPEFRLFVWKRVLPKLMFEGYKIGEKKRIATHLIHNLVLTGMMKSVVADSRDKNKKAQLRVSVWDAVVEAGFAKVCIGSESCATDGSTTSDKPSNGPGVRQGLPNARMAMRSMEASLDGSHRGGAGALALGR